METKYHDKALAEEEKRVRELQRTVDLALIFLSRGNLNRYEAERLAAAVRQKALDLFPDKGETFDLIYGPRLRRVISSRFGLH